MKYRPDIDGLRAVAVVSVLVFHAGWGKIPGGFVGVDVFFVISGYLISSIIFSEIAGSHFSLVGFYERRIRRIMPALIGLLAVSSVFAYFYLLPNELVNFTSSMLAATVSVSNLYFWRHSGYFDLPISHPLLHTWSLAVEEQFYLSFPLFLLLVHKLFPRRLKVSVVAACCISLVASVVVVAKHPQTAFYMPYTRAWELLLGTILSLKLLPQLKSPWLRNLASISGLAMIVYADLYYTQDTLFPGLGALPPCVGAALIIWAGESGSSFVGAALSLRPIVFIGLISYSLYLWHWPVIVLRQMGVLVGVGAFGPLDRLGLLSSHHFDMVFETVLAILISVLSWKFVERPFRNGRLHMSGRPLFASAGAAMLILVALSTWTIYAGGFKSRFPPKAVQVASILDSTPDNNFMRTGVCFITTEQNFENYDPNRCLREDNGKPNYLLLGDSHSAMLWSALASSLKDANVMQASAAACEPSLYPSSGPNCKMIMDYIFHNYLESHRVQGMLIAGRWEKKDMGALSGVITWAKERGLPVTVFGPVPEYDAPLPRLLAYSIAWNEPKLPSQHLVAGSKSLDKEMQRLAAETWHVPYVSLYQAICGADGCVEYADATREIPLMGDTDHLSPLGASVVVRGLVDKGVLRADGASTVSQIAENATAQGKGKQSKGN
jgi:peptidoglycan/LPS O-acetylase OafA/YrhL